MPCALRKEKGGIQQLLVCLGCCSIAGVVTLSIQEQYPEQQRNGTVHSLASAYAQGEETAVQCS